MKQAKWNAQRSRKGKYSNDCYWEIPGNNNQTTSGVHTTVNTEEHKVFETFSNKSVSKLESSVLWNMNKR